MNNLTLKVIKKVWYQSAQLKVEEFLNLKHS